MGQQMLYRADSNQVIAGDDSGRFTLAIHKILSCFITCLNREGGGINDVCLDIVSIAMLNKGFLSRNPLQYILWNSDMSNMGVTKIH